jgi:hypothetical protein
MHHFISLGCVVHHTANLGTQKHIYKIHGLKWHTLTSLGVTDRDENDRKRYLFGNQFFGRFSLIANK